MATIYIDGLVNILHAEEDLLRSSLEIAGLVEGDVSLIIRLLSFVVRAKYDVSIVSDGPEASVVDASPAYRLFVGARSLEEFSSVLREFLSFVEHLTGPSVDAAVAEEESGGARSTESQLFSYLRGFSSQIPVLLSGDNLRMFLVVERLLSDTEPLEIPRSLFVDAVAPGDAPYRLLAFLLRVLLTRDDTNTIAYFLVAQLMAVSWIAIACVQKSNQGFPPFAKLRPVVRDVSELNLIIDTNDPRYVASVAGLAERCGPGEVPLSVEDFYVTLFVHTVARFISRVHSWYVRPDVRSMMTRAFGEVQLASFFSRVGRCDQSWIHFFRTRRDKPRVYLKFDALLSHFDRLSRAGVSSAPGSAAANSDSQSSGATAPTGKAVIGADVKTYHDQFERLMRNFDAFYHQLVLNRPGTMRAYFVEKLRAFQSGVLARTACVFTGSDERDDLVHVGVQSENEEAFRLLGETYPLSEVLARFVASVFPYHFVMQAHDAEANLEALCTQAVHIKLAEQLWKRRISRSQVEKLFSFLSSIEQRYFGIVTNPMLSSLYSSMFSELSFIVDMIGDVLDNAKDAM